MTYTNTTLLTTIKQRGMVPSNNQTWTDAKILDIATEELRTTVVPLIMSAREEYLVMPFDTTIVSGTTNYPINNRAVGMTLRDLFYINANGAVRSMAYLDPEQRERFNSGNYNNYMFYLQWNEIVLVGSTSLAGSLRQVIQVKPGDLVETTDVGTISAIDTATKTVTVSSMPSDFANSMLADFVKAEGGHEFQAIDQTVSTVDSGTGAMVFASALPDNLAVGDYVTTAGESPVPQVPDEMMPLLAHRTIATILESLGDFEGAKAAESRYDTIKQSVLAMISPRVQGEAKKIVSWMGRRNDYS